VTSSHLTWHCGRQRHHFNKGSFLSRFPCSFQLHNPSRNPRRSRVYTPVPCMICCMQCIMCSLANPSTSACLQLFPSSVSEPSTPVLPLFDFIPGQQSKKAGQEILAKVVIQFSSANISPFLPFVFYKHWQMAGVDTARNRFQRNKVHH
jgi:hypothetical protein